MQPHPDEPLDRALETWLGALQRAWGDADAGRLRDALVAAGARHGDLLDPERLGVALAERGVRLEVAHDWLADLPNDRAGRRLRRQLLTPTALVRLTVGWADAAIERGGLDVTAVAVPPQRIHEHLRRVADEGVGPDIAIVVASAAHPSSEATMRMAEAAAAVFAAGEPIARGARGNVVVLARRDDALDECLDHLGRVMAVDPVLEPAGVQVWVEPIGRSVALLDALLIDIGA